MSGLFCLAADKIQDWAVVVLGVGTVFVGLIAIILLCTIMGALFASKKTAKPVEAPVNVAPTPNDDIPNRQEFVAAVSAAIAEDMGTDVSAIRIKSIKKV